MSTTAIPDIDALAAEVQSCKAQVASYKRGYMQGHLTYDDLAEAGKALSNAMYEFAKAKFPDVKPKRIPYQAIIR